MDSEIPTDEIIVFAEQNGLSYMQVSSKTGEGVNEAFNRIILVSSQKEIEKSAVKVENDEGIIPVGVEKNNDKKKTCC